ncbi:MAG: hypothetical protein HC942_28300 [Microcoleus sp. SU_5_6]|nr:hypothetical protein [Microcoleus sp. SU_5_6]NJL68562.1 hypothetical protein [Microcoleus sp. SM1_3_4]
MKSLQLGKQEKQAGKNALSSKSQVGQIDINSCPRDYQRSQWFVVRFVRRVCGLKSAPQTNIIAVDRPNAISDKYSNLALASVVLLRKTLSKKLLQVNS